MKNILITGMLLIIKPVLDFRDSNRYFRMKRHPDIMLLRIKDSEVRLF